MRVCVVVVVVVVVLVVVLLGLFFAVVVYICFNRLNFFWNLLNSSKLAATILGPDGSGSKSRPRRFCAVFCFCFLFVGCFFLDFFFFFWCFFITTSFKSFFKRT